MKSKAPNERPFSACSNSSSGLTPRSLPGVGHLGDLVADRVHGLAVLRLHLADVDVLDRVMGALDEHELSPRSLKQHISETREDIIEVGNIYATQQESV